MLLKLMKHKLEAEAAAEELPPAAAGADDPVEGGAEPPVDSHDADVDEIDWGSLVDEDEVDAVDGELESQEAAESSDQPAPQEAPAGETEAEDGGEAEGEQQSEPEQTQEPKPEPAAAQEQQQQAQAQEQPQQPEVSPEQAELQRQALRERAVQELVQQYQLDEETAEQFEAEPAKVLPKLAADLHMRIYETVVPAIMQQLAPQVEQVLAQREAARSTEEKFFEKWAPLKEHKEQVAQIAYMWRQMNPQADEETALEEIGKYAMLALGYQLDGQAQQQEEPAAPSEPPPPPHRGTVHTPPAAPRQKSEWDAFVEEVLSDES